MENVIKIEKFSIAWNIKNSRIKQRDRDNNVYENRSDFKLNVAKILIFVLRGKRWLLIFMKLHSNQSVPLFK